MRAFKTFQTRPFPAQPPAAVIVAGRTVHAFTGMHARKARAIARKLAEI